MSRVYRLCHACFLALFFVTYLFLSQQPLYQVGSITLSTFIPPRSTISTSSAAVSSFSQPFLVSSGYGLFRMMTGVSTDQWPAGVSGVSGAPPSLVSRPEIQIEGYDSSTDSWKTVPFSYKPSGAFHMPRFVAPHQPRLDWQMWFAALSDYSRQPWLINLMNKLLQGGDNSADVMKLLDSNQYRLLFTESNNRPLYIRSRLFHLDFTRYNYSWATQQGAAKCVLAQSGNIRDIEHQPWWCESFVAEYTPALERDNGSVKAFLEGNGIVSRDPQNEDQKLKFCLRSSISFAHITHRGSSNDHDKGAAATTSDFYYYDFMDKIVLLMQERLQYLVCNSLRLRKYLTF